MASVGQNKEELSTYRFVKSDNILVPRTTLASIESLTFPLVQEVVILADFKCEGCQKRVADIISRMNGEFSFWPLLSFPFSLVRHCRPQQSFGQLLLL